MTIVIRDIKSLTEKMTLALGLGVLVASTSPTQAADELFHVTAGAATVTTPPYAAYNTSVPMELFFEEEGLNVELIGLDGATVAAQALETGRVDLILPANSGPLALLSKFPDAGFVSFYTFINGFQSMPAVLQDSDIQDMTDLEGKTIGVQSLGNSQVQTTKALVALAGGDPSTLNFVAVGEGLAAAHALESDRVDALCLFDGLYGQLDAKGVKLRQLSNEATSQDKVGFVGSIVSTQDYFDAHRDVLVKYGRAVAKGTAFAKENPEAAVRIHWKYFPETRQRGISEEEALASGLSSLESRLANIFPVDGKYGYSTPEQIEGYLELMKIGGLLDESATADNFWTTELIDEINDFDVEAVRDMARNWQDGG